MKNLLLGFCFSFLLVTVFSLTGCTKNTIPNEVANSPRILFWGEGCSHCENIEAFLKENPGLAEKLKLKKQEVFQSKAGKELYLKKATECQKNTNLITVPMMFWQGECVSGFPEIVDKFKKEM